MERTILKPGDKVYVIDWGKHYSTITKWKNGKMINILPFKTEMPDYSGVDFHWETEYEPNLNLNGTVNKRNPKKVKQRIPVYKQYKYEVLEVIKHPKAGEYVQDEETRKRWAEIEKNQKEGYKISEDRYTTKNILLLASTNSDKLHLKCFVVIEETGVSLLTPEEYADNQFNALINAHLGKYDKDTIQGLKKELPKEIISKIYDADDNVLFGSSIVKGKVSYQYLEGKFTKDGIPLYISCSISYDGTGNADLPEGSIIKQFHEIRAMFPHNQ